VPTTPKVSSGASDTHTIARPVRRECLTEAFTSVAIASFASPFSSAIAWTASRPIITSAASCTVATTSCTVATASTTASTTATTAVSTVPTFSIALGVRIAFTERDLGYADACSLAGAVATLSSFAATAAPVTYTAATLTHRDIAYSINSASKFKCHRF
jgi:hypothetical protein